VIRWPVILVALFACSAPARLPELAAAEQTESSNPSQALASYRVAQQKCAVLQPKRRAIQACGEALLGEAELLEHLQQNDQAVAAYLAIPARAPDDPVTSATALYRAGELLLHDDHITPAWTALWKVVTDFPDEPIAADALKTLVDDGRTRDANQLAEELRKLLTALTATKIADNLMWSLADLEAHELADPTVARELYDRIPLSYPDSGLRDDSRWFAAQLSIQLGDPKGAVTRLRALLATREVALGVGSYFSVWLDDAQLLVGKLLRDELHDLPAAAAAFRQLPKDYPASILRDDALFELAVTLDKMGDTGGRCRALAQLKQLEPDSKYVPRGAELGACP
jgi:TolA-binding protein